jgi:hypothetical protein
MADPDNPEHGERLKWVGGPFDPAVFDLDEVNDALARLAWRPLPGSASSASPASASSSGGGPRRR